MQKYERFWMVKQQDNRLPPGYFAPSNIVKDSFEKDESGFFSKILCFFIFSKFSNFSFFPIFAKKNLKNKVEKPFREKIPFETHYRKNLPHVGILKNFKVFRKNQLFFQKTPKFWTFWEFLLFQSHSAAKLLQFSGKKISRSETWTNIV